MTRTREPHPIYELFRREPPKRETKTTQACAYWNGYDGVAVKYESASVTLWAYRAGRDNRLAGEQVREH